MLSLRELCINEIVSKKINDNNDLPLTLFNNEVIKFISEQQHEYVMYLIKFIPVRIINETNIVIMLFNRYVILYYNNYRRKKTNDNFIELTREILNKKPNFQIIKLFLTKCGNDNIDKVIECIPKELFNVEIVKLLITIYSKFTKCKYGFLKFIPKELFNDEIVKLIMDIGLTHYLCNCYCCDKGILHYMPNNLLNDEIISIIIETYEQNIIEIACRIPTKFFTNKVVECIILKYNCGKTVDRLIQHIPAQFLNYDTVHMCIVKSDCDYINRIIRYIPQKIFNREILKLLINKSTAYEHNIYDKYIPKELFDDEIIKSLIYKHSYSSIVEIASIIPIKIYTNELATILIKKCSGDLILDIFNKIPIELLDNGNIILMINKCTHKNFFNKIPKSILNDEVIKLIISKHITCNNNKMHTYDNYNELLEIIPNELQTDEIMKLIDTTRDIYNKSLDKIADANWF